MTFKNSFDRENGPTPPPLNPDGLKGITGTRWVEPTGGAKEGGNKDFIRLDDPYNRIPPDRTFTGEHFHSSGYPPFEASRGRSVHLPRGYTVSPGPPSCRRSCSQ